MGWFHSLGSKAVSGAKWLGSKAKSTAKSVGSKLTTVGDIVSNVAEHVAPVVSVINPAWGETVATVGGIARGAATAGRVLTALSGN
jgi:hypothetical protein